MKATKRLAILIALLLLLGALAACNEPPQAAPEATASPTPTQTPIPEPTAGPDEPYEPEETPPIPDADAAETTARVRVYYVLDAYFNRPEVSPHEFVDLSELEHYHEFVESEEIPQRIVFKSDAPVETFRFLELEMTEDGTGFVVEDILYQLDVLTPETPFVVTWWPLSTVRIHRGISFEDETGVTRYFAFHTSGYDGALFFIEFERT